MEQGLEGAMGGGGGMVQTDLAGEEAEGLQHWSVICVGSLVGGGELR